MLGGDGAGSFSTPLATLHKFNGWADLFLATPAAGLRDSYLQLGWATGRWRLTGVYHRFAADQGGARFGNEADFSATYRWRERSRFVLKLADYAADGFGTDTRKLSLQWDLAL